MVEYSCFNSANFADVPTFFQIYHILVRRRRRKWRRRRRWRRKREGEQIQDGGIFFFRICKKSNFYLLLPTSTYFYLLLPISTYCYLHIPTSNHSMTMSAFCIVLPQNTLLRRRAEQQFTAKLVTPKLVTPGMIVRIKITPFT